ncbi:hypothetical protein HNQ80_000170 [Anaerosolibacter carboniphilus]|uniref:Transporter n=1 Tax=Anaerosolibacter carboniphilus TaxID=1417629 RepID=A0A841KLI6_9FIRM|nr:hypothetical protein [Anaerosolibacter carboniphilus]MBB6214101.1 hypothetical protein [Anaerosolibacter carboniphilus]
MVQLTALHYIYIFMVLIVMVTMAFRKDTVLPCIIGLFVMGYASSGSLVKGVQVIYNALIAAGKEFWGIIVVISLVVAMSHALRDIGADELMMRPIKKWMTNPTVAFFGLGFVMMLFSWFIWPSPSVALVGAIMLPGAIRAGLPAIWAAVAMNIFGHGVALSSDYFIQGAPAITAKAAAIANPMELIQASIPLWLTMSVVTVGCSYFMMRKEMKTFETVAATAEMEKPAKLSMGVWLVAVSTPLAFLVDVFIMYKYQLRGGDATALVGGTAILIMSFTAIIQHNFISSFEKITDYIRDGFGFGIKVFAPVIIIGAFFFLGSEGTAKEILGENATGLLSDMGLYLADRIQLSKLPVAVIQMVIGGITGLDGSGFSGLPLVGALAQTFSSAIEVNKGALAVLGQISAIWVGGGTIIPWGIIPVAAICNVNPLDLVRKNIIPVCIGFVATLIVALFIL